MIVIPMAGLSSRFTKAGYDRPKYMLPLHGRSVFWHAVMSFKNYFKTEKFLFVARNIKDTFSFLRKELEDFGIESYEVVFLDKVTNGQAETVVEGLRKTDIDLKESLTVFNIDSFRTDFRYPDQDFLNSCDGYVEVFKGSGDNWSYAKPLRDSKAPIVERMAEKKQISDLCSNGLYFFSSCRDFLWAFEQESLKCQGKEIYVAPLYNYLIEHDRKIFFRLVSKKDTIFCGTPSEYLTLLRDSDEE